MSSIGTVSSTGGSPGGAVIEDPFVPGEVSILRHIFGDRV